jgi:predicted PurR-regulated permease PerM
MRPSDKFTPPPPSESKGPSARAELRTEQWIGYAALALVLVGCFVVVRPFLTAILWAVILAFSTWPIFVRIERATGGRTTLSALTTTLLLVAVLIVPLSLVGASLADNVRQVVENLRAALACR